MRARRGVSVLEVLAALALLGAATWVATALDARGPRATQRLVAQRLALRGAEAALEAVRAGALPPLRGPAALPGAAGEARGLRVRLEVRPAGPSGLLEVRATATVPAPGPPVTQSLATLVWRGR